LSSTGRLRCEPSDDSTADAAVPAQSIVINHPSPWIAASAPSGTRPLRRSRPF
jgi:hypothetical protein